MHTFFNTLDQLVQDEPQQLLRCFCVTFVGLGALYFLAACIVLNWPKRQPETTPEPVEEEEEEYPELFV